MRVAFVTSIHPDFDARIWKYAVGMARRGHTVHLVCPWEVEDRSVQEGVMLHTFARTYTRPLRLIQVPPRMASKLFPLLSFVDLVHFHDLDILPWMALLAIFKPVVYDVHENYPDEMLVREYIPRCFRRIMYHAVRFGQAALVRLVRNAIFVLPEIAKHLPKDALHTAVIRNYATLDLLCSVRDDYRSRNDAVIFIGSNYESNGTFLFLEIAARFLERRPNVRFLIIDRWADSVTKERAMRLISAQRLTNVEILANVPPQRVMDHLNRATVGLSGTLRLPNHVNALPTKLFEYMAAGLPIVSSDLPNPAQIAAETQAILLARPEEPESFISAIEKLLDDREFAHRAGQDGQRIFRTRFCWESQMETVEKFYAGVLAGGDRSGIQRRLTPIT